MGDSGRRDATEVNAALGVRAPLWGLLRAWLEVHDSIWRVIDACRPPVNWCLIPLKPSTPQGLEATSGYRCRVHVRSRPGTVQLFTNIKVSVTDIRSSPGPPIGLPAGISTPSREILAPSPRVLSPRSPTRSLHPIYAFQPHSGGKLEPWQPWCVVPNRAFACPHGATLCACRPPLSIAHRPYSPVRTLAPDRATGLGRATGPRRPSLRLPLASESRHLSSTPRTPRSGLETWRCARYSPTVLRQEIKLGAATG